MRSGKNLLALSIMFFIFAVAFSVIFWEQAALTAKIGLFTFGFASGITLGQWFLRRNGLPQT